MKRKILKHTDKKPWGPLAGLNLFKFANPEMFAIVDRKLTKEKEGLTDENIEKLRRRSDKALWFRCSAHSSCEEHVWKNTPNQLSRRNDGCPFCNPGSNKICRCSPFLLSNKRPDIFSQINRELTKKNEKLTDFEIDRTSYSSQRYLWFSCSVHKTCSSHVWRAEVNSRVSRLHKNTSCPFCTAPGRRDNRCTCDGSLESLYPNLAASWDMDNEEPGPRDTNPKSTRVVKWKCGKCNHQWKMTVWQCVRLKRGCPNCSKLAKESVGAEACRKALTSLKEQFTTNEAVSGMRSAKNAQLYVDFYCPSRSEPKRGPIVIEYDGGQHFVFSAPFHATMKDLENYQLRDVFKNRFCVNNKIHLLRIAYTIPTIKIESIIQKFLSRIEMANEDQRIIWYVGKEYDERYHERNENI